MSLQMAGSASWPLVGVLVAVLFIWRRGQPSTLKHIPTVRYNRYLPDLINRVMYYPKAASMIKMGYDKFKETPFRMLTADGEVIVLPIKYQEELRKLGPLKLSSLHAQYENALGQYTNIIIDSYIPATTVRKKLTPALARIVPHVIDELRDAFNAVLPDCEDTWFKIDPNELFTRLIALATSRVMAGEVLRRNEEWLNLASSYPRNVGLAVILLRPFPAWLRPLVAIFLPPVRQMKQQLRFAKDLFVPMIHERKQAATDPAYTSPDDFLQWMIDLGDEKGETLDPEILAHHMLLLVTLAVVHTSSMALHHILHDLIAMPEYLEPLREEIKRTLPDGWYKGTKTALSEQHRLDSFMRESQRLNPPGELSVHRIVREEILLHDGLVLPVGTHVCFAAGPISKDINFLPDHPEAFDGFRWCRESQDRYALSPELAASHTVSNGDEKEKKATENMLATPASFVTISPTNMHFGFGVQACPGRFFAANTLKAILSRIILDFDFKVAGNGRPANIHVGEHILPSINSQVLFRKRAIDI
ncbi:uncharacterized protein N7511_000194 [Penicillium nucicola]|uniref:uncharacterized protein n=1 Tax=Penicillium nucicola TaxID=1850975 RepID=UPI002544D5B7|nr:uncharacterized protein N7511_000194 [Penicillium nucicola]KAJ5775183.1 hypothetical protein N7511_000194 [Penicillium nucicola]